MRVSSRPFEQRSFSAARSAPASRHRLHRRQCRAARSKASSGSSVVIFSTPSSFSTIQNAESQSAHTRATLSDGSAYCNGKVLLSNKLRFFAAAIVPCRRKVNPVSVKRCSCYGKGTIDALGASPRRVHWVERSRKLKKKK